MSSVLSKSSRYPNGLNGLVKNDGVTTVTTSGCAPANGQPSGVTATVKKYGPNLSETQGNLVNTVQHSATTLAVDSTVASGNAIKNAQNYGPGETKHAIESPGSGQDGSVGQVGQGGATFGQPAGYSIKGD